VQKGWGMLQVFENDREKAEELIGNYLESRSRETTDLTNVQEPITETSDDKFISNLIFKIAAVVLIGVLIGSLVTVIVWLIRNIFR
jgi:hypothetical protein